jgi:hypothetical protein
MPSAASSCAHERVSASTAALLAQYTDMFGNGWPATMLATFAREFKRRFGVPPSRSAALENR